MRSRVALLGIAVAAAACKDSSKGPIVIGVVEPLTGPQAAYGVSAKNGIDLAVKEQQARGGVLHREAIKVVHLDDRSEGELALDAVRRLVTEDKVDFLIGEVSSDAALMMAPAAQRALTPMLTPAATSAKVTEVGEFIFRICFADPFQAEAMARFAVEDAPGPAGRRSSAISAASTRSISPKRS